MLIKRFVSEKHHKILLIADAGRNMAALAPSRGVQTRHRHHIMGAIGLITLSRSDELVWSTAIPAVGEHPQSAAAKPTSNPCSTGSMATR